MTKRRDPLSLEDAVFLVHASLGDAQVDAVTGRLRRMVEPPINASILRAQIGCLTMDAPKMCCVSTNRVFPGRR